MKLFRWLKALGWHTFVTAIVLAIVVHILVVLLLPEVSQSSAYRRLAKTLPINKIKILPPVGPDSQPLPFMSPDMRYAACRFDLSAGPVAVTANVIDASWILALYSVDGANVSTISGATFQSGRVSFVLVPDGDRLYGGVLGGSGTAIARSTKVKFPNNLGLLIISVPHQGTAYAASNDAALRQANCHAIAQ
jgi:uncharacterized membrane protein